MIVPFIVASWLMVTPAKDVTWWDTVNGSVMQHDNQCSLWLTDHDHDLFVTTTAGKAGQSVVAINPDWEFNDWKVSVALEIGNTFLTSDGKSVVIDAVGNGHTIAFTLDQPMIDQLKAADHIRLIVSGDEFSLSLKTINVDKLGEQMQKCQDVTNANVGKK